jgi:hypothetical protein
MRQPGDGTTRIGATGANRRGHRRTRTFANGTLVAKHSAVECRVLDISPEGARIQLDYDRASARQIIGVGQTVALTIKGLGSFRGTIAWRRNNSLGIHITEGHPVTLEPPPHRDLRTRREYLSDKEDRRGTESTCPPAMAIATAPDRPCVSLGDSSSLAERQRIEAGVAVLLPRILERIQPEIAVRMPERRLADEVAALVTEIAVEAKLVLSASEQMKVTRRLLDEMIGFGPLEPLLADHSVSDILVNGPRQVFVERAGRLELAEVTFADDQHVLNIASRIVTKAGRRIDESSPIADARLPDGSRINVVIPPLALRGPMLSIRKFSKRELTLDTMAESGCLSPAMAAVLKVAARTRLNIVISGGTGAGKTTLLDALSQMIDPVERIITIEDAAELQLLLPHVASLETRPPNL